MRRLVLVAGPSGSGKSRLARRVGCPCVRLDDFYLDADAPDLPRTLGTIDWDHPGSWDERAAVAALSTLLEEGVAELPSYSIAESRATGRHRVDASDARLVIAEGVFAIEVLGPCREAALPTEAIYLDRNPLLVFALRLRRDLKHHRKPPLLLLRRGLALLRAQPALKRRALAAGFAANGFDAALEVIRGWMTDKE